VSATFSHSIKMGNRRFSGPSSYNFERLSEIQIWDLKNLKTYCYGCLYPGLSNYNTFRPFWAGETVTVMTVRRKWTERILLRSEFRSSYGLGFRQNSVPFRTKDLHVSTTGGGHACRDEIMAFFQCDDFLPILFVPSGLWEMRNVLRREALLCG